ncbi:electron transfer flavoprotein beta subunit [Candidatus Magnetomoraceae bacterium gMMP-15]
MQIVVLMKQVFEAEMTADSFEDTCSDNHTDCIILPHDEIALEEALRLKESHGGSVTVIFFEKESAIEAVQKALAMGADDGVLIMNDIEGNYRDTLLRAHVFASFLKTISFRIILTGSKSVDGHSHLTGPALAETLSLPCLSKIVKQKVSGNTIQCHQLTETGRQVVEAPLPVLLTAAGGLNTPRYTTIPGIRRAKTKKIKILSLSEIGMNEDIPVYLLPKITGIKNWDEQRFLKMATGNSCEAKARSILEMLHEREGII